MLSDSWKAVICKLSFEWSCAVPEDITRMNAPEVYQGGLHFRLKKFMFRIVFLCHVACSLLLEVESHGRGRCGTSGGGASDVGEGMKLDRFSTL